MFARFVLLPQQFLMLLVRGYRLLLSPWLGSACRFTPTCSAYALEALGRHGAVAGSALALHRLARCHPWCVGGHDPVPARPSGWLFRCAGAASNGDNQTLPFTSPDKTAP